MFSTSNVEKCFFKNCTRGNLYGRQDVVAFAVNVSHIRNSPEESEEGGVRGDQSFAFVRSPKGDRFDALS